MLPVGWTPGNPVAVPCRVSDRALRPESAAAHHSIDNGKRSLLFIG
jgi:hypothetical protein